jgi:acyl dehydratase
MNTSHDTNGWPYVVFSPTGDGVVRCRENNKPGRCVRPARNKEDDVSADANNNGWRDARHGMPAAGDIAERSLAISERHIELFTEMSGDRNPLHTDREAAEKSRFGGLIVQGGVTTGILNAVVAEDLPGPGSVFLSVDWKFSKPVYVGDTITGRVEILTVREDKPFCTIRTTVENQDGEVCVSGEAVTYTTPLPQ